MKKQFFFLVTLYTCFVTAQEKLPFYEITATPKVYTAGTVAGRMIDGLGFRYHWATEGLAEKDLLFKPSKDARNMFSTLNHILVLSVMTLSAVEGTEMSFPKQGSLSFIKMRKITLENFKKASDILKTSKDISKMIMKIKRGNGTVKEYPFWNQLNGPIADAIWHCGQIVSFRRSAGNPMPKGVSLLTGKKN